MQYLNLLVAGFLSLASIAAARSGKYDFGNLSPEHIVWGAEGVPTNVHGKRQATTTSRVADSACTNGPLSRACWSNGYSIATDFDAKHPTTGVTRNYDLTLTNTTCNPDGHGARVCMLYNGQYPGPTIRADWGDYISITVHNALKDNGTSTHWHGIRQLGTNTQDGVNGLTECPLAPGQSQVYRFQATQFGTSWYHSHFSSQYGEGATGNIVIDGPAAANYDVDLGPLPVTDWFYKTAFQINYITNVNLQHASPPPPGDNILINGTNKDASGHGKYFETTITKGKKYRLRLINTSVDNNIRVSIDNHMLQVITSDFVPVRSIYADSVMLGIGQRYDVIINANQTVGNFWLRASVEGACASSNNGAGLGIIRYTGAPAGNPTTTSTATDNGCNPPGALIPWVPNTVGSEAAFKQQAGNLAVDLELPGTTSNNANIVVWGVNQTAIDIQWEVPTLSYVQSGNTSYPHVANLIELPNEGTWSYWIISEPLTGVVQIPHPIHLHGHDFYIMGTGSGTFDINKDPNNLVYNNPTRRDTTMLPGGGWLVIAFPTDNPGAWLMHCHIAWHISEGLGVQFLESKSTINLGGSAYAYQCAKWTSYQKTSYYKKDDSGL